MGTISDKLEYLADTKEALKQALIDQGQTVDDNTPFRNYATKVSEISGGGGEANIFAQTTEPTTKKGIWLQANRTIEHIYGDDEIFIPGTWEADGTYRDLPVSFDNNGAVVIGTDVYIFGGSGYVSANKRKSAYKFDTLTNTYTQLTSVPDNLLPSGSIVAIGTDVFLISIGYTNIIKKFDTLTNTYISLNAIVNTHVISMTAAVALGTDIYLFGSSYSDYYKKATKYDTLTGSSTSLTDIPYNFSYGKAVVIGTDIYLFGDESNHNKVCKYNTLTDTYTQLTSMPFSFYNGGAVALGTDIYLLAGNSTSTVYKYNTLTDTYTQLNNIPYSYYNSMTVLVENKIFVLGNENSSYAKKIQTLPLVGSTYQDNSVVIAQGKYYTVGYGVELYNDDKAVLPLYYAFADAWFYTTTNGIETNIPTYYGDGTNWIKIKN